MNKTAVGLLVGLVILLVISGGIFMMRKDSRMRDVPQDSQNTQYDESEMTEKAPSDNSQRASGSVNWEFNGEKWTAMGTPPSCVEPIQLQTPVDLSLVTNILYPGQTRSGDYKSHGGFRFEGKQNTDVTVKAPLAANLVKASRYIEQGEVQYYLVFINPCGIAYKFDHLLTLAPKIQEAMEKLPEPKVDDSRTGSVNPPVAVSAGETIATAVGFKKGPNVSVDFGVYDLRKTNSISTNSTWASQHANDKEFGYYALCWLDLLGADTTAAKALPGSGTEGKTSDYCK